MTHSIDEARVELIAARTSRRGPAVWAVEMASEVRRVDESALDALDDAIFGRVVEARVVSQFQEAGLCEESAQAAARGLAEGVYFSFADAAIAQTTSDAPGRNLAATPERIAEVARVVEGKDQVEEGKPGVVTEAYLDALDDAVFGVPFNRPSPRISETRL